MLNKFKIFSIYTGYFIGFLGCIYALNMLLLGSVAGMLVISIWSLGVASIARDIDSTMAHEYIMANRDKQTVFKLWR